MCVTKREPRQTNRSWAGVFKVWVGLSRRPLLVRTSGARFYVVASEPICGEVGGWPVKILIRPLSFT